MPTNTTLQKWNTASKAPRADGSSCSWTAPGLKCANLRSKLWSCCFHRLVEVESPWTALNWSPIFKALPILRQETNSASMKLSFLDEEFNGDTDFYCEWLWINVQVSSTQHCKLKLACWPLMVDLVIYANTLTVIFKQIETIDTSVFIFYLWKQGIIITASKSHNIVVDFWWSDFSFQFIIPRIRSTLEINTNFFFYIYIAWIFIFYLKPSLRK